MQTSANSGAITLDGSGARSESSSAVNLHRSIWCLAATKISCPGLQAVQTVLDIHPLQGVGGCLLRHLREFDAWRHASRGLSRVAETMDLPGMGRTTLGNLVHSSATWTSVSPRGIGQVVIFLAVEKNCNSCKLILRSGDEQSPWAIWIHLDITLPQ